MPEPLPEPSPSRLPRWRGFNLTSLFMHHAKEPWPEEDFRFVADWGFNFVRLPMSYRCWTPDPVSPRILDEQWLGEVDRAVELGQKYGLHVNLNLHRAPGYTVARPPEPRDLWTDPSAQADFSWLWSLLARRYRGIDNRLLSFDLLNEPALTTPQQYFNVARQAVAGIRSEDPDRLIIADGLRWGRDPVPELVSLGIAQSTRGYEPMPVSHAQAEWVNWRDYPHPTWPLDWDGQRWDRDRLRRDSIDPWLALQAQGVGVHVGEFGAHNRTPHPITLRWMEDYLSLWRDAGWGWALWNLRGSFGILDSARLDVDYEPFHGHQLDRAMLNLLQRY